MTSARPFAVTRRDFLVSAAALLPAAAGCRCSETPRPGPAPSASPLTEGGPWKELRFEPSRVFPQEERALVLAPPGAAGLPVVIALHGRGETRSLEAGAHGFRDDYGLDRVDARLRAPPLSEDDLLGFVTADRLARINASLEAQPYRGVNLACPFAPDLRDRSPEAAEAFGRFVTEILLPKAREVAGAPAAAERTGIDGVSMGGRLALWIGLRFAELFGAVGAMQPALREDEAPLVAARALAARRKNPGLKIRLLSSDGDPFLGAVKAASARMNEAGVAHDLVIAAGPHSYEFNRGPGCAEMLLWQERALRGLPSP